jgi:hypothetical protein
LSSSLRPPLASKYSTVMFPLPGPRCMIKVSRLQHQQVFFVTGKTDSIWKVLPVF